MTIEPASLDAIKALCLGFAWSGLLASAFEALAGRPADLRLLRSGDGRALACVPLLVFSAPCLILRAATRRPRFERARFGTVFTATIVACLWSLACGRLVLDAAGLLAGA